MPARRTQKSRQALAGLGGFVPAGCARAKRSLWAATLWVFNQNQFQHGNRKGCLYRMKSALRNKVRREPGETGCQTDGNTGRKKLVGSTSRNSGGSRSRPPANLLQAQRKFGRRIHALRQKLGLSEQRLATDCGMSAAKLRKIESGQIEPDLILMIRLSARFDIRLDHLLRGIK
jgi:ribosome-binding protein aMBF1 (putative translation factor)